MFDPDLVLETSMVRVRVLLQEDRTELEKLTGNKSLWKFFPSDLFDGKDLKMWIEQALQQFKLRQKIPFVIVDKKLNRLIGCTSYGNISEIDQRLEIGWTWLGKDFQGKGFNPHCKFLLLRHAFELLDFERVEFKTDVLNQQSRNALRKIGAVEEGVLRSHTLMPGNRRRDTIYYSILKKEWEYVKSGIFSHVL